MFELLQLRFSIYVNVTPEPQRAEKPVQEFSVMKGGGNVCLRWSVTESRVEEERVLFSCSAGQE